MCKRQSRGVSLKPFPILDEGEPPLSDAATFKLLPNIHGVRKVYVTQAGKFFQHGSKLAVR